MDASYEMETMAAIDDTAMTSPRGPGERSTGGRGPTATGQDRRARSSQGGDPVSAYMREIAKVPMLPAEQQLALAAELYEARSEMRADMFGLPVAIEYVAGLAARLRDETVTVSYLLAEPDGDERPSVESRAKKFFGQVKKLEALRNETGARRSADASRDRAVTILESMGLSEKVVDTLLAKVEEAYRIARKHRTALTRIEKRTARTRVKAEREKLAAQAADARASLDDLASAIGLPSDELLEMMRRIRRAKARAADAKKRLVESNLRLVVSHAKRYPLHGLGLLDLIQEGNVALMRAVDKFDHRLGFRLTTYASYWIRQAMSRALANQGRTIRVPWYLNETIRSMRLATRKLSQDLGREPTTDEVANEADVPERTVRELRDLQKTPMSLDEPIYADESAALGDFLEDTNAISPSDVAESSNLDACADAAVAGLPRREQDIIRKRFGLGHDSDFSLEEVGADFGVTRERIRQIECAALARLRRKPGCK